MTLLRSPRASNEPAAPPPRSSRRSSRSRGPHRHSGGYTAPARQLTRTQSYRPILHRTIPLALFASVVLALIGVLEYSIRTLPHDSVRLGSGKVDGAIFAIDSPVASAASAATADTPTIASQVTTAVNVVTPTSQPSPPPSAGKPPESPRPTAKPPASPPASSPASQPKTQAPAQAPAQTPGQSAAQVPAQAHTQAGTPPAQKGQPDVANSHASSQTILTAGAVQNQLKSDSPSPTHAGSEEAVSLSTSSASEAKVLFNVASTMTEPVSGGLPTGTSATGAHPQTQDGPATSDVPLTLLNGSTYFSGIYLPIIMAVLLRLLAGGLYRYTKLIDPFTMLSQPNGALLQDFFRADHLDSKTLLVSWYAIRGRRWMVLCAAAIYGVTQMLTLFASELNTIGGSTYSSRVGDNIITVRGEALWINQAIARLLQVLLIMVLILVAGLWFLLRRHHSGLLRNPASLAAITSLVGHPGTAEDLGTVSALADENIAKALSDRRYRLQSYTGPSQHEVIGIVPTDVRYEDLHSRQSTPTTSSTTAVGSRTGSIPSYSRTRRDVSILSALTAAGIVLTGLVATYSFSAMPSLDHFMDPQQFGPRFLLTALALILKAPLLDVCIRATASISFSRLAARPRHSYLDLKVPVPLTPIGSVCYALRRCAWLPASFAIASGILIELLFILLPGVPFKPLQQDYIAPRVSSFGSIACLVLVLLLSIVGWVMVLLRRGLVDCRAPRPTLGSMLMSVAGTSMAADCALERSSGGMYELRHANAQRWAVDYAHNAIYVGQKE